MRVRVLYFAAVREIAGASDEMLDLPASVTTVGAFVAFVAEHRPALAAALPSVRIAKNEEFAEMSAAIAEGDVLALIPPVAGG